MVNKLECDNSNEGKGLVKPLKKCESGVGVRRTRLKKIVSTRGIPPQRIKRHESYYADFTRTEKIRSLRLRYQSDEPGLVDKVNDILGKDKKLSDDELIDELDNLDNEDLGELFLVTSFGNY